MMGDQAVDKKRTIWIVILAFIICISLYAYYNHKIRQPNQQTSGQGDLLETAVVYAGEIEVIASGSGEVVPASQIGLRFAESGTVLDILVKVGDKVKTGDVLARLQRDKTEAELAAEIANAELAVVQAQADLANLYSSAEIATAKALINLEKAQLAFEEGMDLDLEKALALQEIAYAQESIASAQMLLYIYNSLPSEEEIYTLYASWLFKQEILDDLTRQVEQTILKSKGVEDEAIRERFEQQLMNLTQQQTSQRLVVEDAIYKLNTVDDFADPLDVNVAESQLTAAQAKLASSQKAYEALAEGLQPGAVAIAEARLSDAQKEYQKIKYGPDPEEIASLEVKREKAILELEVLKTENTIIDLVAPVDGTIIQLDLDVGDRLDLASDSDNLQSGGSNTQSQPSAFEQLILGLSSSKSEEDVYRPKLYLQVESKC